MDFACACSNILTNYCWKDIDVSESLKWSLYSKLLPKGNIYFGVDVWAQNKSDFRHPRVTWPEVGGGGTNTGMAVRKIADYCLSVGIFAPAWSFEHFPDHGRHLERAVWEDQFCLWRIDREQHVTHRLAHLYRVFQEITFELYYRNLC